MTGTSFGADADLRTLMSGFKDILLAATANRHLRDDWVPGQEGRELGWVAYERTCMHAAVNQARKDRALPPLPLEAVMRVERQAQGHSDYVAQFAYGCARLVAASGSEEG